MKTHKNLFIYMSVALLLLLGLVCSLKLPFSQDFVYGVEGKTFDLRQNILAKYKTPSEDIVIIGLDTKSYEYIVDTQGSWPVKRSYWANIVKGIQKAEPKLIVLDFMYPKRNKSQGSSDDIFINTINKNNNVILGMFFNSKEESEKTPPKMPEVLKNTVQNDRIIKNNPRINFDSYQPIMEDILYNNKNIGFVNFTREKDGIIKYMPVLMGYEGAYYKNITFLAALRALNLDKNSFEIKKGNLILNEELKIPLNDSGRAILNWYKPEGFKTVSLSETDVAIQKNDTKFLADNFKGKIVYLGATTSILNDIKSSPTSTIIPGVEVHATFLNNILDNNFIYHTDVWIDILITLAVCALTGFIVMCLNSVLASVICTLSLFGIYFFITLFAMQHFNLWLGVSYPLFCAVIIFITSYILKYILKAQDYEQTYKLAVTDVMTQLFNHRYFQEQMIANTQNFQRYEIPFSMIMIDIDFFKKFNDTYGHQSGDAVLKQVAQIIKSCVRSTDIPCRYGGEEMSVILTNTGKEESIITAYKICETVRNTEVTLATGDKAHVTISVGVGTIGQNGQTPKDLIEYCDKCLYRAKENGRNQVVSEI